MATLSAEQVLALANQFTALGDSARSLLSNPNVALSGDQSNIVAADMSRFYTTASNLATMAASLKFADSETTSAFDAIRGATTSANDTVDRLSSEVNGINGVIDIFGSVVKLAIAISSGNVVTVITAASDLANTVSNP